MKNKAILISGLIGLTFGVLFSGTLGLSFFGSEEIEDTNTEINDETDLNADEEKFRIGYNLDDSIYIPIYEDAFYDKIEAGDTFILYIGRKTCPYCQQFVPNLMEAAINQDITEIYHIDTVDSHNQTFVDDEGVHATPTTFIVIDGVIVRRIVGYKSTSDMEQIIIGLLT